MAGATVRVGTPTEVHLESSALLSDWVGAFETIKQRQMDAGQPTHDPLVTVRQWANGQLFVIVVGEPGETP